MIPHVMHQRHQFLPEVRVGGSCVSMRVVLPQPPLEMFGTGVCVSSILVTLQLEYHHLHIRLCHNIIIY